MPPQVGQYLCTGHGFAWANYYADPNHGGRVERMELLVQKVASRLSSYGQRYLSSSHPRRRGREHAWAHL